MGITQTTSIICRGSSQLHQLNIQNSTSLSTTKQSLNYKSLTEFRSSLLPEECVYTFKTLMKEYFQIYKKNQNIVVSDYLCKINPQGDLFVFCTSTPCFSQPKFKNYVDIICKIFEIVCDLCISDNWINSGCGKQLKQSVKIHILKLYNYQQLLHNKIISQSNKYLSKKNFTGNLLDALIRSTSQKVDNFLHSEPFRRRAHSFQPILNESQKFSELSLKETYEYSNPNSFFRQKSNKSNFYPNTPVKYQISSNSFVKQSCSEQASSFNESMIIHKKSIKRSEKRPSFNNNKSYISPQFSINILSIKYQTEEKQQKNLNIKNKRKTHLTTDGYIFQKQDKQSINRATNRTSVNFTKTIQYNKPSHNKVKSVLDTMARLVEVKQIPSSKSFIY